MYRENDQLVEDILKQLQSKKILHVSKYTRSWSNYLPNKIRYHIEVLTCWTFLQKRKKVELSWNL